MLPDAYACHISFGHAIVPDAAGSNSYLVEVHVHALKLQIRRAIVPAPRQLCPHVYIAVSFTYTPEPSRPCSPEMVCQKAAPI